MAKYKKRSDGRYATTIQLGYNELGKPIKKIVYGKTIKELEAKITEYRSELVKGTDFSKRSMTFGEYQDKWWSGKQIAIKEIRTKEMYVTTLKYLTPLSYIKLTDVTSDDIQQIINKHRHHPRTCQNIKLTLNQIFKKAIAERILYYNPVDNIFIPSYVPDERRPLTDNENFLTELDIFTDRERAFVLLIKYTGIRKGEALALTKSDVNLSTNTITVSKSIAHESNRPVLKGTKNGSTRIIPLPTNILPFLSYYISNLKTELLFTNLSDNGCVTQIGYKRMWQSIIKKLSESATLYGVTIGSDLTAHIFRHNYACVLMYAGVNVKEAQYLLGHKTIAMTMDIYTHLQKATDKATDSINQYFIQSSQKVVRTNFDIQKSL